MAKNLPNVTLDLSWTDVISPSFALRFLNEAIETVPSDKVLGFGAGFARAGTRRPSRSVAWEFRTAPR